MFIVRFPGCAVFMFMTCSWMALSCCPYLYITQHYSTGIASSSASGQLTLLPMDYMPYAFPFRSPVNIVYQYHRM